MMLCFLKRRETDTAVVSGPRFLRPIPADLRIEKCACALFCGWARLLRQEFDPTVKEAAAWAIGYIAQHTAGERAHQQRSTEAGSRCETPTKPCTHVHQIFSRFRFYLCVKSS